MSLARATGSYFLKVTLAGENLAEATCGKLSWNSLCARISNTMELQKYFWHVFYEKQVNTKALYKIVNHQKISLAKVTLDKKTIREFISNPTQFLSKTFTMTHVSIKRGERVNYRGTANWLFINRSKVPCWSYPISTSRAHVKLSPFINRGHGLLGIYEHALSLEEHRSKNCKQEKGWRK